MSVSPNQNNKKRKTENEIRKRKIKIQDQRSRPVTNWPVTDFTPLHQPTSLTAPFMSGQNRRKRGRDQ
jgi:hypothetical protein